MHPRQVFLPVPIPVDTESKRRFFLFLFTGAHLAPGQYFFLARSTLINFFQIIPAMVAVVAVSVAEVPGAIGELFNSTSPISLRSRPWMVTSKSSPYRTPHPPPTSQCRWLRGSRGSKALLLANMVCRSSSLLFLYPFIDSMEVSVAVPCRSTMNVDCMDVDK